MEQAKQNNTIISPRKLIETALPLDSINKACAYEKMPGIGPHPRGIHHWWARRPLAAARAVIFSQLVNDPAGLWEAKNPGQKPSPQQRSAFTKRRKELFNLIEELVRWENTTNEDVLNRARAEIKSSWKAVCELNKEHPQATELFDPEKLPGLHDPFAGGGAIPLEAQRLGLEAWASDLNPVAVLINKAMIEIPPKFANLPPVGPLPIGEAQPKLKNSQSWVGAAGLAEDVRRYGAWMREEAEKRIGHLYPKVKITAEMVAERPDLNPYLDKEVPVIAWLWARTVKSPNPAFSHVDIPLISNFILSNKTGKEAYIEPIINGDSYCFRAKVGKPPAEAKNGTKASGRGADFVCLLSNTAINGDYIKSEGKSGRMGSRLLAIVCDGINGRIYLSPNSESEKIAKSAEPDWKPSGNVPARLTGGTCVPYGLTKWGDLFTNRQLVALNTFSNLVSEVREKIKADAISSGIFYNDNDLPLAQGGEGPTGYSDGISIFLSFAVDRCADFSNTTTRWVSGNQKVMNLFAKQAIAMTWDFPEANIIANTVGSFLTVVEYIGKCILKLASCNEGFALQNDAQTQNITQGKLVSTDPPYYDNIAYADLSDFFYVWMRHSIKDIYPDLFSTMVTPKSEELIASPHRQGSKSKAEEFFLNGMTKAMHQIVELAHPEVPVTIYYAFKQSDSKSSGTTSTGWETFLGAVLKSGLAVTGTWPLRSEQEYRMIGSGANVLASSIVLVCRKRSETATTISRREFQRELNMVLPEALDEMTRGSGDDRSPVAPVDLSQAIIGPGMAVFSKYSAVLEADGSPMTVKTALQLINRFLAEDDFDADTQFCLHWFEQNAWKEGAFGEADVLARAKATSVDGLTEAGVLFSGSGKVRLRRWNEYPTDWDPSKDKRLPIWEALHQLIRALRQEGETASGQLLADLGGKTEAVRQLAYRLYTLCERLGYAEDARAYNELITSWTGIETAAASIPTKPTQKSLFD